MGRPRIVTEKDLERYFWNRIYIDYKKGAKRRNNMVFDISKEKLIELCSSNCLYCNQPPQSCTVYNGTTVATGVPLHGFRNGIDRANNEIGYIEDNCVPCCKFCNQFKRGMTKTAFLDHCKTIIKYQVGLNL